jgi:hypothetical protein
MSKTPATKITIVRVEGPNALCYKEVSFEGSDCWAQAHRYLVSQGETFPRTGGYDKHDFVVTFGDGETWEGRLDCQHPDCADPDLDVAQHVYHFAAFYAGTYRPSHMTQERYEAFLGRSKKTSANMRRFLETYEVPEAA